MSELNPAPLQIMTPRPVGANVPPDWATPGEEICCPLCGYNLRGLTDARCPECGYSFVWSQLLDPAHRKHPYLFEHHPEKNVRSFFKTAIGGLRPKRFWNSLSPVQTCFPGRLMRYWLLAILTGVVALLVASTYQVISEAISYPIRQIPSFQMGNSLFRMPPNPTPTFQECFRAWSRSIAPILAIGSFILLALWPWITFLALMIFQISMRRAGIRKTHVLRTVLYSGDFVFWAGLASTLAAGAFLGTQIFFKNNSKEIDVVTYGWGFATCWVVMAYRLGVAYRRYLRFDHPLATVIASQIVAALLVLTIFFQALF